MVESYSSIRALADFIRDIAKYQQAFWHRCRGTAATLSADSVVLVSFSFSFLLPQPPLPMEQLSFPQLSTPRGEFSEPSPPSYSSYELGPVFIAMVRKRLFSGEIHEDPYEHLQEFEELCSGLEILGMTQEALRWKLLPFSLIEKAEQWHTRMIGSMSGDWEELRCDFCYSYSLTERIDSLLIDILDFEQLEKESIGAAWARFSRLLASIPDMSIPDKIR